MAQTVTEPELTLPPMEADWVREWYGRARTILEYGSGGSTMLAARMPGKTVFSVENDPDWVSGMRAHLAAASRSATVHLHHVDIGPVRKWGRPQGQHGARLYHRYPLSVFDRDDFEDPEVVLIDGRFRAACLFAVMARVRRPVNVLFDDYTGRENYQVVEKVVAPSEFRGRMARFEIAPTAWPPDCLTTILEQFTDPR